MYLRWFGVAVFVVLCLTIIAEKTASQSSANSALQDGMYVNFVILITSVIRPTVDESSCATVYTELRYYTAAWCLSRSFTAIINSFCV